MTQQRVCNKCGIEGRENGRFAAGERASEESSLGVGRGTATEDSHSFFSAWTRVGGEGRKRKPFLITTRCLLPTAMRKRRQEGGRAKRVHVFPPNDLIKNEFIRT